MTNFSDMLSKAKKVQEQMKEVQENIKKIEVEGTAGGDLVKVVLKGDYEMKSITLSPNAKNEKDEIINDLIIAAHNDAKEKLKKKTSEELLKVTGVSSFVGFSTFTDDVFVAGILTAGEFKGPLTAPGNLLYKPLACSALCLNPCCENKGACSNGVMPPLCIPLLVTFLRKRFIIVYLPPNAAYAPRPVPTA